MKIEQFVMAYGVEQDKLRAILPEGFESLRPVLRINAEIIDGTHSYLQLNTAVQKDGVKGWLNVCEWKDTLFTQNGNTTTFCNDVLKITFATVGITGSCPAEKDNDGIFFLDPPRFEKSQKITANKEFCDCSFCFATPLGTYGESIGKTLPAIQQPILTIYDRQPFTLQNASKIPCHQVLGSYKVVFER